MVPHDGEGSSGGFPLENSPSLRWIEELGSLRPHSSTWRLAVYLHPKNLWSLQGEDQTTNEVLVRDQTVWKGLQMFPSNWPGPRKGVNTTGAREREQRRSRGEGNLLVVTQSYPSCLEMAMTGEPRPRRRRPKQRPPQPLITTRKTK